MLLAFTVIHMNVSAQSSKNVVTQHACSQVKSNKVAL